MAMFDHTNKVLELPIDINKPKKLNTLLRTDFMLKPIRGLTGKELGSFRIGAGMLCFLFGAMGYYFYRRNYQQKFIASTTYYHLMSSAPYDAGNQFWWNLKDGDKSHMFTLYYRMPRKEYNMRFRNKSAYISGEFDHDKEILIPKTKDGVEGYDVITPFYYYYKKTLPNYVSQLQDGKPVNEFDVQRAAIAVFRGWIPFHMKDRRLRPHDFNGNQETLYGTIKLSNVRKHDFLHPNDPTTGYWNNYSLEDFAHYWNLPNVDDAKFCYFQEINFGTQDKGKPDIYPIRTSVYDAVAEDMEDKGFPKDRNYKGLSLGSASLSAFCAYLVYLAA